MTTKEKYSHINLMPSQWDAFNGDTLLQKWTVDLAQKHNIKLAIELGTCLGSTAVFLSKVFEKVATVEIEKKFHDISFERFTELQIDNIALCLGDSRTYLPTLIQTEEPVFTWVDSHWSSDNPLIDELAIIARSGKKNVVLMIHDFKVPDHPELGFDSYGGQDYEWSWIEKSIEDIYGKDGYIASYNSEAQGAMRGVVVIEPK